VKPFTWKRRFVAAGLILLALFLIRPGAGRLKSRIIFSISEALGRRVDIDSVHLRLLPRPGFDLENLVVYDDTAFGAEPMLRASEVTAALRLVSLVRGRLEIARLELTEPSLNLVHGAQGRWNVESLLERTARIPLAPTVKAKSEPRPAFPYIEGTSGRINFKNGPEKRPYALTNADFSLWQESDNTWGARLKAQPFRSDMNLNDTGLLQISADWRRAETIEQTPVEVSVEWSRAQVGQLTKFLSGTDQGWRGAVVLDATLKGTPAKLHISGDASVDDFRRYDITSGTALHMPAYCDAEYSSVTHDFHQIMCNAPVGKGLVSLTGDMGWPGTHRYALAISADGVPAAALALLAQRVKRNLPDDLVTEGTVHGSLSVRTDPSSGEGVHWQGRGEFASLHVSSKSTKAEVGPDTVPFLISNIHAGRQFGKSDAGSAVGLNLLVGPFALAAGHAKTPLARGIVSRSGYDFEISGDTEVGKLLHIGSMFGVPAPTANVEGTARVDLKISGAWRAQGGGNADFIGPEVTGTAKLRNVRITRPDFRSPVEIASADIRLLPEAVRVEKLTAKAAGSSWSGWLEIPRACSSAKSCPVHFLLNADEFEVATFNEWLHPTLKKQPWYRVLEASIQTQNPLLRSLRAAGQITADRLHLQNVEAQHVAAGVKLESGKLEILRLEADTFGGHVRGNWASDYSTVPSICKGSGSFARISLAEIAAAMNDGWVEGTASGNYEIKGTCSAEFWRSAEGTVRVDVTNAVLAHLSIAEGEAPLRIVRMNGQAQMRDGKVEIKDAKLVSPNASYQLSGTAWLSREVDLKLMRDPAGSSAGFAISGTLLEPRVTPLTGPVQARLKSLAGKPR
jgi:AsmA family/AsmA-like C-terminal region